MPILKQSGSSHAKRRSRMDLTRDMISAPLGDFRHTMHVGRGGDVFGDTSFLSNHGPAKEDSASPKPNGAQAKLAPQVEDPREECGAALLENSCLPEHTGEFFASPDHPTTSGLEEGVSGWRLEDELDRLPLGAGLKHAESVLSFHVDLGPSMLGDVLGVMEKGQQEREGEEEDDNKVIRKEEIHTSPGTAVAAAIATATDANGILRGHGDGGPRDSASSTTSGTVEDNHSIYEGDSEEDEKRSIYEGVMEDIPMQPEFRDQQLEEEEEEKLAEYAFDDEDDEIGL
ncbi:cdc42 effector protein 4 [Latimeria chalumnae]|uniref:CDC42 effector protein 5 n=1 Tax=Latimeria chalumnae TaxID=7897 RepID=H3AYX2_LATCH|nr:PREDICTED: cdc42 effector protein 5 [Latimeria chalumnae]|eukprot:XP_006000691.1 PREDICTED: cdc42 effector protein 5 [Latimeria chalumnae]